MTDTPRPFFSFGLGGLLGLIFITLKLCGVITWSWWWVLAPFWIGWVLLLTLFVVAGIVVFTVAAVSS